MRSNASAKPPTANKTPKEPPTDNVNCEPYPYFDGFARNFNSKTGQPFYRFAALEPHFPGITDYRFCCNCDEVLEDETPWDTYQRKLAEKQEKTQAHLKKAAAQPFKSNLLPNTSQFKSKTIDLSTVPDVSPNSENSPALPASYHKPKSPPHNNKRPASPQHVPQYEPYKNEQNGQFPFWFGMIQQSQEAILKAHVQMATKVSAHSDVIASLTSQLFQLTKNFTDYQANVIANSNNIIYLSESIKDLCKVIEKLPSNMDSHYHKIFDKQIESIDDLITITRDLVQVNEDLLPKNKKKRLSKKDEDIAFLKETTK